MQRVDGLVSDSLTSRLTSQTGDRLSKTRSRMETFSFFADLYAHAASASLPREAHNRALKQADRQHRESLRQAEMHHRLSSQQAEMHHQVVVHACRCPVEHARARCVDVFTLAGADLRHVMHIPVSRLSSL